MGTHVKNNLRFYIVCAAFGISLVGNFTGFGKDLNQIDTNRVEISEIKRDNKLEHEKILIKIKELGDSISASSTTTEVVRAQNDLIISLIKKKL